MKATTPKEKKSNDSNAPCLTVLSAIVLYLFLTTVVPPFFLPYDYTSLVTMPLLFFNNLNLLICYCEISLGLHLELIKKEYKQNMATYKGQEWQCGLAFLTMPLPNPLSTRLWSRMWSTYAVYDPSYQNSESFGFFIDVGNGWSTIVPMLIWNYTMCYGNFFSPLFVGCIGIASYWQMCYGTIIYFMSFLWNKRYQGKTMLESFGFVGTANGIWFFFPILAIYASVQILKDGDFSVFGTR